MSKKVLSINSGSSSIKFKLYDMPEEVVLAGGQVDRIGNDDAQVSYTINDKSSKKVESILDHRTAISEVIAILLNSGVIQSKNEIAGVGHRISHGGPVYTHSVVVDDDVKKTIKDLSVLSPCIIRLTLRESLNLKRRYLMRLKLQSLILHSTRRCLKKHICMHCHMIIIRMTASEDTDSTDLRISILVKSHGNCSVANKHIE
ncbi:acetate kinase [Lentilactobacillus kosonis]|uniref:butyrate kinase n=1 Tax=Lentilactobacillus kosonis TaxID=2810561 RepID=A0A401FMK2_9LACO|nr:acetate kinase [Lentilactobacillus kosonis]